MRTAHGVKTALGTAWARLDTLHPAKNDNGGSWAGQAKTASVQRRRRRCGYRDHNVDDDRPATYHNRGHMCGAQVALDVLAPQQHIHDISSGSEAGFAGRRGGGERRRWGVTQVHLVDAGVDGAVVGCMRQWRLAFELRHDYAHILGDDLFAALHNMLDAIVIIARIEQTRDWPRIAVDGGPTARLVVRTVRDCT